MCFVATLWNMNMKCFVTSRSGCRWRLNCYRLEPLIFKKIKYFFSLWNRTLACSMFAPKSMNLFCLWIRTYSSIWCSPQERKHPLPHCGCLCSLPTLVPVVDDIVQHFDIGRWWCRDCLLFLWWCWWSHRLFQVNGPFSGDSVTMVVRLGRLVLACRDVASLLSPPPRHHIHHDDHRPLQAGIPLKNLGLVPGSTLIRPRSCSIWSPPGGDEYGDN